MNTSGTLTEETSDLAMLLRLAQQHQARLSPIGLTEDFLREGSALLDEVSGRDLLGILGLRNREEALVLRNSIVTYATLLGNEARAAGINACWTCPRSSAGRTPDDKLPAKPASFIGLFGVSGDSAVSPRFPSLRADPRPGAPERMPGC